MAVMPRSHTKFKHIVKNAIKVKRSKPVLALATMLKAERKRETKSIAPRNSFREPNSFKKSIYFVVCSTILLNVCCAYHSQRSHQNLPPLNLPDCCPPFP